MNISMTKEKLKKLEEIVIMPQVPEEQEEVQLAEDSQEVKPQQKPRKKKHQLNDIWIHVYVYLR